MVQFGAVHMQVVSSIGMVAMALLAIFVRMRGTNKPISTVKIIMPPIGMSTGFLMFVAPAFRVPGMWGLLAFWWDCCYFLIH